MAGREVHRARSYRARDGYPGSEAEVARRARFTLAEWERSFLQSAQHLRAAADTLEQLGRCCRWVERCVREGVTALPEVLQGMRLLPSWAGLLAGGGLAALPEGEAASAPEEAGSAGESPSEAAPSS